MKNLDLNKGRTENIHGAGGINNGKSSVTECPVKDREVGLESNEVETGNVNFYSESNVDCFSETDAINRSVIANSIGKPLIMDLVTARVLVEIDSSKGFKDVIQLMYKDKLNTCKGVKKVKMEYSWKPPICDYYKVFGHVDNGCTSKPRVINVDTAEKSSASAKEKLTGGDNDGFTNVNHKRKNLRKKSTNSGTQQNVKIGGKDNEFMIIASADNRRPVLEKSMYDSWKSRMEIYMENRENERMIRLFNCRGLCSPFRM
nr:hypothetical protein [Tanacetum cinerariifolium]